MKLLVLLFTFFAATSVYAASYIETYRGTVPANTASKKVETAIVESAKARRWVPKTINPGKIELVLNQRSHMVTVDVSYDQKEFIFTYKDSANMKYDDKKKTIHPKYGKWVRKLIKDIENRLMSAE